MPSRILAALRRPKRIATSLPQLRYLVFQGMKGDPGDPGKAKSAYLDEDVVRLVEDDTIYTSLLMRTDIGNGVLPFVLRGIESNSVEEYFELDQQAISAASPVVHFRSRAHLLAVDSTGHFTMTDRPQGGSSADAVLYTPQSLTPAQKEQARENIGAAGADDVAADFAARDRLMQKCAIVVDPSPNRWNKDAAATGLLGLDGRLYTGGSYDNYCYYNIGSVSEGDVITAYLKRTTVETANMVRVVCYDSGGNAVVSAGTSTATQSFTVPSGVASVAICTTKNTGLTYNYMVLVNAESAPTEYIPYSAATTYYVATEDFLPSTLAKKTALVAIQKKFGTDSVSESVATLASETALTLTDAPWFIKKNVAVTARMAFESFTSVEVGKGYESYRGKSIIVDGTNITPVSYNDSGTAVNGTPVAHGLTISDYLQVSMFMDEDGICHIEINTTSGTFSTTADFGNEWNYAPFIVGSQAMENVRLNYSCSDLLCPMWILGDSYLGMYLNRVGGQLRELGYTNFCLNGIAGARSTDTGTPGKSSSSDLNRMLAMTTPNYILWCDGMNGGDANTINYLPTLIELCADKGIELILYKVPHIPTIDHSTLNAYIESTGLRYIDACAAVGATTAGVWYTGMLSNDEVHPSALGAKAIAMRFLTDVPEIMQYGKSGEGGAVESVNGMIGAVTVKTPYYLTVTTENGVTSVDKTPAEIDALSAAGYDVHMRLPMTLGQLTSVADMRFFAALGVALFYGVAWYGSSPLIAVARVTDQKLVSYELTETARMTDIPTSVSELTNDSGYQTAQDVQTAIAGVRQLPAVTASDNGKFLRVVSGAWAAENVPSAETNSFGGGA